ncbi:diguanylate cyclase (GGDEF) domain-containing protein [Actinopolyspora lacussalsi subsp. righensis]|uniref:Diguanylate cyclase (GGDEF) domain-containing protein n=1 Tax=Actinopolyspora righensis TaxID=995060 RepID=A0A1I7ABP8_9ACTN|nr:GGDEF domain-containing protein [Actinopolyspora righensis]SFT72348.1 diguanylate cyclase (GGDEF) domain-containing protein [Actinopolyspora righensis]
MGYWPLWRLRPAALVYVLAVQVVAVSLVFAVILTTAPPTSDTLHRFGMLAFTAGVVIVGTSLSIQLRDEVRRDPWTIHICYLVTGMLTLPPNLLVLLLLGPALHGVLDVRGESYRWMFVTAATVSATFAARAVVGWHEPRWNPLLLVAGSATLLLLRAAIVALGLRLRRPRATRAEFLGDPIDVLLGIVAAALGILLAVAMELHPASALLAAPPMALLDMAGQLPQWRRSAQRDGKTGLVNAVHWDKLARAELGRASSRQQRAAILLLDLDHFKRVNDELGHLAGDAALASMALMLRGSVRKGDLVGRFGGEEFVVLLPDADIPAACEIAYRIRSSTASLSVPARDTRGVHRELDDLTVSIGVAATERLGYELEDLLVAADAALLAAKAGGRNAVSLA